MKALLIAAVCLFSGAALGADKPKPWTAMSVYSDGHLLINENIESEHVCREALCMAKDHLTCEEKIDADAKAAEARKQYEAELEKKKAAYRIDHPCIPKIEEYSDSSQDTKKRTMFHCPLPNGGEEIYYDSGDGRHTMTLSPVASTTYNAMTITGYGGSSLIKQACFQ